MNASDVITVAMSRQDGARAAAVMISDGRLHSELVDDPRASNSEWGEPEFSIGDAAMNAFLANGCEECSRHHLFSGTHFDQDHLMAFWHGFVTVARECLWAGGIK